jgi:hypothetical protein
VVEHLRHVLAAVALRLQLLVVVHLDLGHVAVVELVPPRLAVRPAAVDVAVVVAAAGLESILRISPKSKRLPVQ